MLEIDIGRIDLYNETIARLRKLGIESNETARIITLAEEIERYRQQLEEMRDHLASERKKNQSLQNTIELENEEIQYLNKEIDELRRVNGEYARKHLKPDPGFPAITFPSDYETDVVRIRKDDSIQSITIYFKGDEE